MRYGLIQRVSLWEIFMLSFFFSLLLLPSCECGYNFIFNLILWGIYVVHSLTLWTRKMSIWAYECLSFLASSVCSFSNPAAAAAAAKSLHPTKFNVKRKSWSFMLYVAEISQGSKVLTTILTFNQYRFFCDLYVSCKSGDTLALHVLAVVQVTVLFSNKCLLSYL